MRLAHILLALIPLVTVAQSANAYWQSLGRLNALRSAPDTTNCQQRFINHYETRKLIVYPSSVLQDPKYGPSFRLNLDLDTLQNFTKNDPSKSNFELALSEYRQAKNSKSLSVNIGTTLTKPISGNVFIELDTPDHPNLISGISFPVDTTELGYYELQQSCL